MPVYIPSEKINEIQKLINIVEVINKYVNLKRAGKNYLGLCPFHAEKTPSFSVSPEKQLYKCFGCGEGGTVFTFLMKKEGLSFPEALRALAKQVRVDLPERIGKDSGTNKRKQLYDVNKVAAEFFHKCLLGNEGRAAREYLRSRNIKDGSIKKFRIGYAPDSWDSLIRLARAKGIPLSRLQDAGLIITKDSGRGFYDRFRNRLMFPITDHLSRVVGFGGRSVSGSEPKYINSPETMLFSKGWCLYGLDVARPSILEKKKALIMEGYTDVIMAHQEGISNTVGVLGTAFTQEHIRLLRQWIQEVVLVLDGDTAGRKSSDRSLDSLVEEEIEAKVVQLPEADDPCDFILKEGPDKFMGLVDAALDFFSFKVQMMEAKWDLSSPSGKVAAAKELATTILKVPDQLRRQEIVKSLVEKMSIDEKTFRQQFRNLKLEMSGGDTPVKTDAGSDYMAEKELLSLLLSHNELIEEFEAEIGPKAFQSDSLREIVHKTLDIYRESGRVRETDLIPFFVEDKPAKALADISLDVTVVNEKGDYRERFATWVHYLKRRENKKKIGYTKERIKNLGSNQKEEEDRLFAEFHEKNKRAHLSLKRV